MLFTLTHFLSHPGSSMAHLGLAEGRGEAEVGTGWQKSCVKTRAGWLLLCWALCEQLSPLSPAGPSLPGASSSVCAQLLSVPSSSLCPAPVCAQLLSVPSSGPRLARVGECALFQKGLAKGTSCRAALSWVWVCLWSTAQCSATAESDLQREGEAWWENRAEFQSNDKRAGVCMAQIPERLEESLKWKELFFYAAEKIEHYFGGMRRNVIRV